MALVKYGTEEVCTKCGGSVRMVGATKAPDEAETKELWECNKCGEATTRITATPARKGEQADQSS